MSKVAASKEWRDQPRRSWFTFRADKTARPRPRMLLVWPQNGLKFTWTTFRYFPSDFYVCTVKLGKWLLARGGGSGQEGSLLLFHYFQPILIKLRFIFKTGDMVSSDVLLRRLLETRYASICLVTGAAGSLWSRCDILISQSSSQVGHAEWCTGSVILYSRSKWKSVELSPSLQTLTSICY